MNFTIIDYLGFRKRREDRQKNINLSNLIFCLGNLEIKKKHFFKIDSIFLGQKFSNVERVFFFLKNFILLNFFNILIRGCFLFFAHFNFCFIVFFIVISIAFFSIATTAFASATSAFAFAAITFTASAPTFTLTSASTSLVFFAAFISSFTISTRTRRSRIRFRS